jgi:Tol biopolymer transport system component
MTPGYSPPEQYGTARTDQRSDIFSLGATLYAALTGSTPEDALARAMDQAELTPIRKFNGKVTRRLSNVIERALAVRPDDRYQNADEFKQALLGVNNSVRRRDGDYSISPPPSTDVEKFGANGDDPPSSPFFGDMLPRADVKSPPLLPISTPLSEGEARPRKSRSRKNQRRRSCLLYLVLLTVILALVGGMIYRFDPGMPARAITLYWPTIAVALPDGAGIIAGAASLQSATPSPTMQSTNLPLATLAPVIAASATASPTPTIVPTHTTTPTPTQTPLPTPLGGGPGQVAFASNSEGLPQIYVINSDGSGRRRITNLPEGACQPDWSPDGQRLVFISPCSNNTDYYPGAAMYIINQDGKGLLPLPTLSGGDYDPRWSPDGMHIVFTSLRNSRRPQLYVLNLEDNSVRALSQKFETDYQGSWSPDGKLVVFATTRRTNQQIWVVNVDGSEARQFSPTNGFINSRPAFSPDGKSIIYTQYIAEGSIPRVNIAPFTFEDFSEYRVHDMPMRDAVYSPDGYWLAFEGWQIGGSHNIFVMAATGAAVTAITDDTVLDFDPVWRPAQ